jgi:hypothetical protein
MEEIWKDVQGFEGRFKISNLGNVLSINGRYKGERLLKPCIDTEGYYVTELRMTPINRRVRVHQLVAEHFVMRSWNLQHPCVNHRDGNKTNNNYLNLEWVSKKDNCLHAVETGLHNLKGVNSPNSKVTEREVKLIRELALNGFSSQGISDLLENKISRRHVTDIINRINWKHI